ncbi:DUF1090 family protein [Variovorax sp. OV329]|uniref:DUF1090 family protein n=1 Tax=Variovorax sp. OV329 TaxID=1882825 RepID=UPI0008EF158A|nr:DUF1090 family protein [Variovorax sp. OV329]SFN17671.1 Protein of unknown function [Variovorax sp. OV329]
MAQTKPDPLTVKECETQQVQLQRDMRDARSRGQMLRRRNLEETLITLQARCEEVTAQDTHEARVLRQKYVVMQRQVDLDRAQDELRRLQAEKP